MLWRSFCHDPFWNELQFESSKLELCIPVPVDTKTRNVHLIATCQSVSRHTYTCLPQRLNSKKGKVPPMFGCILADAKPRQSDVYQVAAHR